MTGGKKKRKDIAEGETKFNNFANQAVATQQPFAKQGAPAVNQLSALSGLGGQQAQNVARGQFNQSLFYKGGETAFNNEKDAIDTALSSQGLVYSQARQNAVADARERNYQNALNSFLNNTGSVANIGIGAATNQANTYLNQGNAAIGVQNNIANTRQGFLGGLQQVANLGATAASGFKGF